jgi:hypothetical protein
MKGKASKLTTKSHTAYAGGNSKVASEMMEGTDGFKKGGKAMGKSMGKAEGMFSKAHAGRKPRKAGGGVLSSASGSGTPRGKGANY